MKKSAFKRFLCIVFMTIFSISCLAGFGNAPTSVSPDLSCVQMDISTISVPSHVKMVGLGEASHGVKEYHQMKAEVFQALVKNNGCHTFIIEGDFGGALKVEEYIQGGAGTAEEIVGEIGFAIYRTQEMADLVDWMRSYNETVSEKESLHFYGMDMQRYDNNKEFLFSVLDQTVPELSAEYKMKFSKMTDENRNSLDKNTLKKGKEDSLELLKEMDRMEGDIAEISGQTAFDYARECLNTIYECCDVQMSNSYNKTRDQYMFEKAEWFLQHGDGSVLFINGHNGHIGKTSVSNYTCLGTLLAENLGEDYYAVGTDAQETQFNSQNDNGGFDVVKVNNTNDLNSQLDTSDSNLFFIDFSKTEDEAWQEIVNSKQTITTLNVSLSAMQKLVKLFYTSDIIPGKTFDGMIVFQKVSPTTLLK